MIGGIRSREVKLNNKVRLLASGAFLFAAAVNTSAHAQTQPAAAAASGATIEELVVTAEKRSQSLQEVPIAISAYTSEKRDLLGINSVQDMTNFTPGLQYSSQGDRISLRGVGRLTNVQAADPGVASYSDGVYTSSTVEAGKTPIFVDRVEVLRGPQGTLYGRNSIGGAINVISKRPTEDPYAEVRATVANYGRTLLEGAVSGPLTEGLQFRLGGNWEKQRDGYFKNIVPGMPSAGNVIDQYYIEGQLQGKFGDHLEGWVKAAVAGWNNGSGGPGAKTSYTPGPVNPLETLPSALFTNPGFACSGLVTNVVNASPLGCVNPASKDRRQFANDTAETVSLDESYIISTQWTYHFDNFDLKYIGGFDNYHYTLVQDLDGGAVQAFTVPLKAGATCGFVPGCTPATIRPRYGSTYQENKHWDSHELNLASSGSGPLQWLVGAYYYHESYKQPVFTTLFDQTELNGPVSPAVPTVSGAVGKVFQNRIYDDRPQLEDTSYAAYGQVDWKFTDAWKATLGLRYSHDKKDGSESVRLICYQVAACGTSPENLGTLSPPVDVTAATVFLGGLPKGVVAGGVNGSGVTFTPDGFATRNYDASFEAWTGTAGLQWEPDHDTMAYARYSRGYKAGGFNVGISTTLGSSPYTGPEHSDAFEIGLKKDLLNHTLQTNIAVFYYNYEDLQAPLSIVVNTPGRPRPAEPGRLLERAEGRQSGRRVRKHLAAHRPPAGWPQLLLQRRPHQRAEGGHRSERSHRRGCWRQADRRSDDLRGQPDCSLRHLLRQHRAGAGPQRQLPAERGEEQGVAECHLHGGSRQGFAVAVGQLHLARSAVRLDLRPLLLPGSVLGSGGRAPDLEGPGQ